MPVGTAHHSGQCMTGRMESSSHWRCNGLSSKLGACLLRKHTVSVHQHQRVSMPCTLAMPPMAYVSSGTHGGWQGSGTMHRRVGVSSRASGCWQGHAAMYQRVDMSSRAHGCWQGSGTMHRRADISSRAHGCWQGHTAMYQRVDMSSRAHGCWQGSGTMHRRADISSRAHGCWRGQMPLVGSEPLISVLPEPLAAAACLHSFILVGDPDETGQGCVFADFLPLNPTHPVTALTLLTAGRAPGEVRARKLPKFMSGTNVYTRWVGPLALDTSGTPDMEDVLRRVQQFNRVWDTRLGLVDNNCQHYTTALLAHLTSSSSSSGTETQ